MNGDSKINVHYSSLVSLKAELLKKQAEVAAAKSKLKHVYQSNPTKIKEKKSIEKQKKNKKEKEQSESELEDADTIKTLKKSELMLKAKSRLYDKLTKTHTNMNPNFLVDFEHKPNEPDISEEEPSKDSGEDNNDTNSDYDSDSEWVEYTDCFGRTRKCLKEDLKKMKEEDEKLKEKFVKKEDERGKEVFYVEDREPEKEPEIELMRRKWEEQTAKLANKVDIHYQDILFDEARTHGVGYYAFSQDEEERLRQQENLMKLRKETEQKQKENQDNRDAKNKIQQNRLRIARLRQRIRAGLPIDETEKEISSNNLNTSSNPTENEKKDDSSQSDQNEENTEQKETEKNNSQEVAKKKLEDIECKIQAFGELLGKRNRWYVMSQEEWVSKKRKERINEFAPVYDNFEKGESFHLKSSTEEQMSNYLRKSEDKDSETIGPMPPMQNIADIIRPATSSQDESDIIGPMSPSQDESNIIGPLPTIHNEFAPHFCAPPSFPGLFQSNVTIASQFGDTHIGPVPPPQVVSQFDDTLIGSIPPLQVYEDQTEDAVNITKQVEAGLKFLRQQFEKKHS